MKTTVHIDGFYGCGDGRLVAGMNVSVCPPEETPHEAFVRIVSNIEHFGGTVTNIRREFPIGGYDADARTIEWEAPAHGDTARMWHVVTAAPADQWAAKP